MFRSSTSSSNHGSMALAPNPGAVAVGNLGARGAKAGASETGAWTEMVPQLVVRSKKATHASQRRQPLFCGLILLPLTADTLQEHPTAWVCAESNPSAAGNLASGFDLVGSPIAPRSSVFSGLFLPQPTNSRFCSFNPRHRARPCLPFRGPTGTSSLDEAGCADMDVDMVTDAAQPAPVPAPTTPASAGSPGTLKHGEPRRRNRPALSCIQCRTRKIRCDRNEPCASCMKSKIVNCTYEEARRPKPRLWRLSPAPAAGHHHPELSPTSADERAGANSAFTFRDMALPVPPPTSNPPCAGPGTGAVPPHGKTPEPRPAASPRSLPQMHHAEPGAGTSGPLGNTTALAERVRQLEQQLADALKRPDYGSPSARSAHQTLSPDLGPSSRPSKVNSMMNGEKLFPLAVNIAARIESDKSSEAYFSLQRCRELGSTIQSTKAWSSTPPQLGKSIPPKDAALQLVNAYFRTFESVYRIIHRPTFWQGCQEYWDSPTNADPAFVVQLQLCMAIGACFQDDAVALRRSAIQWMCVETSLKLYRAIATGSPAGDSGTASQSDDFTRLATCGYGAFRAVPTLAVLTICLELLWQVQEDRSFRQSMNIDHPPDRPVQPGSETDVGNSVGMGIGSGAAPRLELLEAVKYSIGWTERRVRCGETNVKGYILFSALLCQAQALQRGASDAEVERSVLTVVGEELNRCLLLLRDAAGRDPSFAVKGGEAAHDKKGSGWGAAWGPEDAVSADTLRLASCAIC
ncbi:hypothetical protein CHGG_05133 [Chaetomium globosum CBS 148.51]|uniref:Zn(2)-C6 fungal-type domain-containing protein n=1 Tax=Chaetomium globosum (strain ATCC 6205 / CBS 148.51 / DSM 1962 / NBRC 6347 / NRRL 1970) TaxID=306901 RepID=Q2GZB3_CHAGB|nr:uncharacterized protein CHGG_05133 [Chaetomium globosum CBS 148.51]EAQ88514.1 hypothetical protein CHGG_05133 [Chaetomium globosum CBS 148.51]